MFGRDSLYTSQSDIFQGGKQQFRYNELCNAIYERELQLLAQSSITNASLLRKKLGSLSYYVRKAGLGLLDAAQDKHSPLELDTQNASWQAKQAIKCPASGSSDILSKWLTQFAKPGLPIPLHVGEIGFDWIVIDCIDRIDVQQKKLHLNEHGWFNFNGVYLEDSQLLKKYLLKPSKATMTAACCGHTWGHKGRTHPRTLTLREILLTSILNWQNFATPKLLKI